MKSHRYTIATFGARGVRVAVCLLAVSVVASAQQAQSDLWIVPPGATSALTPLEKAVADLNDGRPTDALSTFARSTGDPVIGGYAWLYWGRAQFALGRADDASNAVRQVLNTSPTPALAESANWLAADVAEGASKWADAMRALQAITVGKSTSMAQAHFRLGRAASRLGNAPLALSSFLKVYYEFPLTQEATDAGVEIARLTQNAPTSLAVYPQALGRAIQLFGARRYADARKAFEAVRGLATGDDRQLVDLRLAECDFHQKRYALARDALKLYLGKAKTNLLEAEYFHFSTLRELGRSAEYLPTMRAFVDAHPEEPLAEAALNDLATSYILADADAKAAAVFLEMTRRFPAGAFGDRAAWKAGWWAYKNGDYATTVRLFEAAATTYRRADYRPSWLYWAAKAHDQLGERDAALTGFRRVIVDYRNSFYGRQAMHEGERLLGTDRAVQAGFVPSPRATLPASITAGVPPVNTPIVTALLTAGLYDQAVAELRRTQIDTGSSPLIEATIAYALHRKGEWRPAITGMRRAYPQFMAEGGEFLPREILAIIFPVDYWDLIKKYSSARDLDPFLMSALIAQESTFQADVRSSANAWGLMQVIPATGRRYAQRLGIQPFATAKLTEPEVNIRIGMAYFADLLDQFGDVASALAAYNAGEGRVVRWRAERPGVPRDEFIDDIPFPETQNYVKRIIGTAEDYRFLYRDRLTTTGIAR